VLKEFGGKGFGVFKPVLAELAWASELGPIAAEIAALERAIRAVLRSSEGRRPTRRRRDRGADHGRGARVVAFCMLKAAPTLGEHWKAE